MLYVGSIVSFFFFGTQYMQAVLGYSALQAGLGFLPQTILTFLSAMMVLRLTRLIGGAGMLIGALLLIALGFVWMAQAGSGASYWQIAWPMALIGLGKGAAMAPLTTAGVRGVEHKDQGAASGLVNVAHQLGGSIGLSVLIVVFAANAARDLSGVEQIAHQVSAVMLGAAAMNVLALVLAAVFILPAQGRSQTDQASTTMAVE